jgi:hypothetical protein
MKLAGGKAKRTFGAHIPLFSLLVVSMREANRQ